MKLLVLIAALVLSSCGSDGQTVCDKANDLASSAMNAYCAGKTCCICRCNNQSAVMECGDQLWDCATPPYNQVATPWDDVCPEDPTDAEYCMADETQCWDAWYATHQSMCERYP